MGTASTSALIQIPLPTAVHSVAERIFKCKPKQGNNTHKGTGGENGITGRFFSHVAIIMTLILPVAEG